MIIKLINNIQDVLDINKLFIIVAWCKHLNNVQIKQQTLMEVYQLIDHWMSPGYWRMYHIWNTNTIIQWMNQNEIRADQSTTMGSFLSLNTTLKSHPCTRTNVKNVQSECTKTQVQNLPTLSQADGQYGLVHVIFSCLKFTVTLQNQFQLYQV